MKAIETMGFIGLFGFILCGVMAIRSAVSITSKLEQQINHSETRCEEQVKAVQDLLEERIGILEVQVESLGTLIK